MANSFFRQITQDGPRNAGVKVTGTLDAGDATLVPILGLSELTNNEPDANLKGLRVNFISYSLSDPLQGVLEWESSTPEIIAALAGREEICAERFGGFIPDMTRLGYQGDVNFRTQNYPPGTKAVFTIIVDFVKLYA